MTSLAGIVNGRILTINSPSINVSQKKAQDQEWEQGNSVIYQEGACSTTGVAKQKVKLLESEYYLSWKLKCISPHENREKNLH